MIVPWWISPTAECEDWGFRVSAQDMACERDGGRCCGCRRRLLSPFVSVSTAAGAFGNDGVEGRGGVWRLQFSRGRHVGLRDEVGEIRDHRTVVVVVHTFQGFAFKRSPIHFWFCMERMDYDIAQPAGNLNDQHFRAGDVIGP